METFTHFVILGAFVVFLWKVGIIPTILGFLIDITILFAGWLLRFTFGVAIALGIYWLLLQLHICSY